MLSRNDIKQYIYSGDIKIYPFEQKNLTGIGYNLSTTNFAFSINRGVLLTVFSKTTSEGIRHYINIPPNDTVLFFSKEYISVSNKIAGTFHSKVGCVCQGLGHISTTLDPTWHGQLIISVNNPTNTNIEFDLDTKSGNIFTMFLYKFETPVEGLDIHDNNSGRCDLLMERFLGQIPKQYRDKHLELKKFVVNEFADSLNGYDDFLNNDINDKYARRIQRLTFLKKRLEKEKLIIEEDRYEVGQDGKYYILKDKEEKDLLRSCELFKIVKTIPEKSKMVSWIDDSELKTFQKEELVKAGEEIIIFLKIINYELSMLNHLRRLEWQNNKILEYAGEESELVILKKENFKKNRRLRMCKAGGSILLCIVLFAILEWWWISNWGKDNKIIATTFTVIITLLVSDFWSIYKGKKKIEDSD